MSGRKTVVILVISALVILSTLVYYNFTMASPNAKEIIDQAHIANKNISSLSAVVYLFRCDGNNKSLISVEHYEFFAPNIIIITKNKFGGAKVDNETYFVVNEAPYSIIRVGPKVYYIINNKTYVTKLQLPFSVLPITDPYNFEKIGQIIKSYTEDNHYVIIIKNKTNNVSYYLFINKTTNMMDKSTVILPNGVKFMYVFRILNVNTLKKPNLDKILQNPIPVNMTEIQKIIGG